MMTARDNYSAPFTLTRDDTVYVKTGHVPFMLGTLELEQVIFNRMSELKRELQLWEQLAHDNDSAIQCEYERVVHDND